MIIQLSGLLQPLRQFNYDLLFNVKPYEQVEENIILIELEPYQLKVNTRADNKNSNFSRVLEKLIQYQPKALGFRFEGDLWGVYGRDSDGSIDSKSYNISYAEKLILERSFIKSKQLPSVINSKFQVASSKLLLDSDFRVRRFHTRTDIAHLKSSRNLVRSKLESNLPYVGVALASTYLMQNGWTVNTSLGEIRALKEEKLVSLGSNIHFANLFYHDRTPSFSINWRKVRNSSPLKSISADALLGNRVSPDLLSDKLVILDSNSVYQQESLQTPLTRWTRKQDSVIDSLIIAQVADTIINSVENNRTFISFVPQWFLLALTTAIVVAFSRSAHNSLKSKISLKILRSKYWVYSFLIGTILIISSIILFAFWGIIFDVVPAFIAFPFTSSLLFSFCRNKKEARDFDYLRILVRDFKHNINNISRNMLSNNRGAERDLISIIEHVAEDLEVLGDDTDVYDTSIGRNVSDLRNRCSLTENEILRISRYEKRITSFLEYTYSSDTSELKELNLNSSIDKIVSYCEDQRQLDYEIKIRRRYDSSIEPVKLRANDLDILVENLIDNAINAVDPKLSSENNTSTKRLGIIKISTLKLDRKINIIVEDNGIGIPFEYQQQIFKPFISLLEGGQGIGLHLVFQIISNLNGTITLESAVNQGSKFTISFPIAKF